MVGEKKKRKVIHYFFVETTKGSGLPNSGNAWFDSVVQFKPLRVKSCVVADEKKRELAATLRELNANEAAKKTLRELNANEAAKKTKAAAATKRSAIEKNTETPLLKRHQPDKLNSARSTPTHQPNEIYSPRLRASAELRPKLSKPVIAVIHAKKSIPWQEGGESAPDVCTLNKVTCEMETPRSRQNHESRADIATSPAQPADIRQQGCSCHQTSFL